MWKRFRTAYQFCATSLSSTLSEIGNGLYQLVAFDLAKAFFNDGPDFLKKPSIHLLLRPALGPLPERGAAAGFAAGAVLSAAGQSTTDR